MLRGEFRQFSVERLLRFLVALDQDLLFDWQTLLRA
jgi:hypothetical protein